MNWKNIVFRVDRELETRLKVVVKNTGLNMSSLIRYLLIKQLDKLAQTGNLLEENKEQDDEQDRDIK